MVGLSPHAHPAALQLWPQAGSGVAPLLIWGLQHYSVAAGACWQEAQIDHAVLAYKKKKGALA